MVNHDKREALRKNVERTFETIVQFFSHYVAGNGLDKEVVVGVDTVGQEVHHFAHAAIDSKLHSRGELASQNLTHRSEAISNFSGLQRLWKPIIDKPGPCLSVSDSSEENSWFLVLALVLTSQPSRAFLPDKILAVYTARYTRIVSFGINSRDSFHICSCRRSEKYSSPYIFSSALLKSLSHLKRMGRTCACTRLWDPPKAQ